MECVISDGHLDTPKLVNSVHQLLQLHRSTVSHTEDLTTTLAPHYLVSPHPLMCVHAACIV